MEGGDDLISLSVCPCIRVRQSLGGKLFQDNCSNSDIDKKKASHRAKHGDRVQLFLANIVVGLIESCRRCSILQLL